MKAEENNKPAKTIEEEGEKVTGGPGSTEGNTQQEKSGAASAPAGGEEARPEADSKKEEISGYNEHPDQAKVGGG